LFVTRLLINIDHVATLRNARGETFPDPIRAAALCEDAGADGIVFHLREDRRHIRDDDVAKLRQSVRGKLDFEMSLAPEIVDICVKTRPHLATLVPERREELTTEGGLDVIASLGRLRDVVPKLRGAGIEVATFIDPDLRQVEASFAAGCDAVEFHTGEYASGWKVGKRRHLLDRFVEASERANELGLTVHAGHGLDYDNYPAFGATVPHLEEVSIGFAIVAESVFIGLEEAVTRMLQLVRGTGP
jgi:pyridoxine 5-phosphate synthase